MKRKLAWMAVLVVFVLIALSWCCLLKDGRIGQDTYDHIRLGMTLDEVQKAIGPVHDQSGPQEVNGLRSSILPAVEVLEMQMEGNWAPRPNDNEPGQRFGWIGMDGIIMIRVDQDGRVTDRMFAKLKPMGLFDRLRWRLATMR